MILSIESSCDDSSIALTRIKDYKIIFHQKISQDKEHSTYGGVVPELASRLHCVALPKILSQINPFDLKQTKAIAVTNEPGLSVSLIEGVMMAKALAMSLKLPLIAVNHLQGHIYSLFLEKKAKFPLSILLLSGGHSLIIEAINHNEMKIIANTLDDSFGESFDKVAKMLSLGYPGGPIVESYATKAKQCNLSFPIPLKNTKTLAFSFSGLKNAVRLEIQLAENLASQKECGANISFETKANICYAFQQSAIEHIAQKCRIYLRQSSIKYFGVVGGASANQVLRHRLESLCGEFDKKIIFAPIEFCSDNAAMIGRCGIESFLLHQFISLNNLDISPKSRVFHKYS